MLLLIQYSNNSFFKAKGKNKKHKRDLHERLKFRR